MSKTTNLSALSDVVDTADGGVTIREADWQNVLKLNRNLDIAQVGAAGVQLRFGAIYNGVDVYPNAITSAVDTDGGSLYTTINHDGADQFKVDRYGRVTMPYQPMFRARSNYSAHTVVNGKMAYDYVEDNVGNHYNGSTLTFTVPVDGVYYFTAHALVNPNGNYAFMSIYVNGSQSGSISHTPNSNITSYIDLQCNEIRKLYAGDTVYVDARCYGSATVHSSTSFNHFSGYLLG